MWIFWIMIVFSIIGGITTIYFLIKFFAWLNYKESETIVNLGFKYFAYGEDDED